jgi:hypothetical protein
MLILSAMYSRISDISTGIAIRYLGGILELPTFWVERNYQLHRSVAERLFKRTGEILKDIGVDSSIEFDESMTEVSSDSDTEGIDLLVDAILAGVQVWMQQMLPSDLVLECWFDEFVKLIKLLRRCVSSLVRSLLQNNCLSIGLLVQGPKLLYRDAGMKLQPKDCGD